MSKKADRSSEDKPGSPQALRKAHLMWEKNVRSIGILFYLPAILLLHRAALVFTGQVGDTPRFAGLLYFAFGLSFVMAGYGFRRLNPTFRVRGGILAALGVILFSVPRLGMFFPAGIAVSAYVVFLIFGPPGRKVFSKDYQQAVAATPHIKANPPVIVWVAFIALLAYTAMTMANVGA